MLRLLRRYQYPACYHGSPPSRVLSHRDGTVRLPIPDAGEPRLGSPAGRR